MAEGLTAGLALGSGVGVAEGSGVALGVTLGSDVGEGEAERLGVALGVSLGTGDGLSDTIGASCARPKPAGKTLTISNPKITKAVKLKIKMCLILYCFLNSFMDFAFQYPRSCLLL